MKKYIVQIVAIAFVALSLQSCGDDEGYLGQEIFNDSNNYPYVSIQDRNEDLDSINGNNFWSFELTAENNGNQVRIAYDSQDPNIVSHDIIVGFDDSVSPPKDGVVLTTITEFPTELVFTKNDIAAALNVPVSDVQTGSVYFGGRSIDGDNHIVENPDNFEDFLVFERHAYFYEWPLDQ